MSDSSRNKDKEMASHMKKNPGRYTDSVSRPWRGVGSGDRELANKLGASWQNRYSSTFERGFLGGVLAAKLGYGKVGISDPERNAV